MELLTGVFIVALFKATELLWEKGFDAAWDPVGEGLKKRFTRWAGKDKASQRRAAFDKAVPVATERTVQQAIDPAQAEKILKALDSVGNREGAEALAEEGIEAGVINGRFIKPLDHELILDRTGQVKAVVTVEENNILGGFGSAVCELLAEKGPGQIRIKRLGIPDCTVEHGSQAELRAEMGLDAAGIAAAVRGLLA